jgi:hypothetical protein
VDGRALTVDFSFLFDEKKVLGLELQAYYWLGIHIDKLYVYAIMHGPGLATIGPKKRPTHHPGPANQNPKSIQKHQKRKGSPTQPRSPSIHSLRLIHRPARPLVDQF